MAGSATVAVEATEERFRALKHHPSLIGFEVDGTARWPADQFTFRLARDGAIRLTEDLHESGAPVDAPAPQVAALATAADGAADHQE